MLQDQYPYLPGHLVEFKDGGLQIKAEPNAPATESVLIIGPAIDGPVGTPVATDPPTLTGVFGKAVNKDGTPNGNLLVKAFEELWKAGCRDIRCMRSTGTTSVGQIPVDTTITDRVQISFEEVVLAKAPGNLEAQYPVANGQVVRDSVIIKSLNPESGIEVELPESALISTDSDLLVGTIKVAADVTGIGYSLTIQYDSDASGTMMTYTENYAEALDGSKTYFITSGPGDVLVSLSHEPANPSAVIIKADGVQLPSDAYRVGGTNLTLIEGGAPAGAKIEAFYKYYGEADVDAAIKLESAWASDVYNNLVYRVENIDNGTLEPDKKITIIPPVEKVGNGFSPLVYTSLRYPTVRSIVQAINNDLRNVVPGAMIKASCPKSIENQKSKLLRLVDANLTGGSTGIDVYNDKDAIYQVLDGDGTPQNPGIYKLLENYRVDYIIPLGVYHDDVLTNPTKNFSYQLALACAVISHRSKSCHGLIATQGPEETSLLAIDQYANKLVNEFPLFFPMRDSSDGIIYDEDGNFFDLGRYISVLAGPDVIFNHTQLGSYTDNSPGIYGGMISSMAVQSSPMNKPVPGIAGMRFAYSNKQRNALTGARYVTYTFKDNNNQIVVQDAMTAAQPGSDYCQLNVFRAVKVAADAVRDACDPFIGEPSTPANRNAMSSRISKELQKLQDSGAINGSGFEIIQSPRDLVLGQCKIELTVIPPLTLRKITTVVSLKPA